FRAVWVSFRHTVAIPAPQGPGSRHPWARVPAPGERAEAPAQIVPAAPTRSLAYSGTRPRWVRFQSRGATPGWPPRCGPGGTAHYPTHTAVRRFQEPVGRRAATAQPLPQVGAPPVRRRRLDLLAERSPVAGRLVVRPLELPPWHERRGRQSESPGFAVVRPYEDAGASPGGRLLPLGQCRPVAPARHRGPDSCRGGR